MALPRVEHVTGRRLPITLKQNTTTKMAMPGNVATHHDVSNTLRPSEIISPQSGDGGWVPRPRNAKPPMAMITIPRSIVACTTIGVTEFGKM